MESIFRSKQINNKRQVELDCAKGLAVVFMVWVHVNEYYQGDAYYGGTYNRLVEFLGSPPAAPVFMFLLGLGIVYARHNSPMHLAHRGFRLLIGGYVFSLFRDMIPYLILYKKENDASYIGDGNFLLWGIDILQFAGLVFLFFALVKKCEFSHMKLFIFWCIFASLNILLQDVSFSSHLANSIFGLFWGTSDYSWFPFFNWITYPMAGYVFGEYLIRCSNTHLLYKRILMISVGVSIPLWIYSYINDVQFGAFGELWQQAYYHHDIIGNLVLLSFVFLWISLFYFIVPLMPKTLKNCMVRWGRNITDIYVISYLILGWSFIMLSKEGYAPAIVCILTIIIFSLSDFITVRYKKVKSTLLEKKLTR